MVITTGKLLLYVALCIKNNTSFMCVRGIWKYFSLNCQLPEHVWSEEAVFPVFFSNDESCDGENQNLLSPPASDLFTHWRLSAGTFSFDSGLICFQAKCYMYVLRIIVVKWPADLCNLTLLHLILRLTSNSVLLSRFFYNAAFSHNKFAGFRLC